MSTGSIDSTDSAEPNGTAALLVNPRGQYLLHLRDANKPEICDPGTWSIPGGGREGNESAHEAIVRELKEETGLTVPLEPFTVVDCTGPDGGRRGRSRCTSAPGTVTPTVSRSAKGSCCAGSTRRRPRT